MPSSQSRRSRRAKNCKVVTASRVCGPRKSCAYPKVYSRRMLVSRAKKSDDFTRLKKEQIPTMSKYELCSRLGLTDPNIVKDYRIFQGKVCGPDKDKYNALNVWSKKELEDRAVTSLSMSKYRSRKSSKLDLCSALIKYDKLSQPEYPLNKLSQYQLPAIDSHPVEHLLYKSRVPDVSTIIYKLLVTHKNLCMYITPYMTNNFDKHYIGIHYDCKRNVLFGYNLLRQMQSCHNRFFLCLISLRIQSHETGHMNFILYDKQKNIVYGFEPLGRYKKCRKNQLNKHIAAFVGDNLGATFISSMKTCPNVGISPKALTQSYTYGLKFLENSSGMCAVWNIFMADMIMRYPDTNFEELLQDVTDLIAQHEFGAYHYMRTYLNGLLNIKQDLKHEAKNVGMNYNRFVHSEIRKLLAGR